MDPQAAQRLIQTQPQKADAQAREWSVFASEHPGVSHFVLKQEFDAWARTHGVSDTSVWFGKEVQDAYFYLRKQHEEEQLETQGHIDHNNTPTGLATLGFLAAAFARERPRIMEEDPDFKRILKEKGQTWLDDHPDKDVTSKEWIDYRYGSLEKPNAPTLYTQTEEAFRPAYEKRAKTYDEERKKIYSDPSQDPTFIWHQEEINLHAQVRHELLKKQDPSLTIELIQKQVETHHWEKFVEKYGEKASVYAQKHEGIKSAVSRIEERKKQTAAPKIETKPVVEPTPPRPPIIAQTSISPKPSQVNQQLPQSFETTPSLSFQTAQPPPFPIQRVPSSIPPPSAPPVGGAGQLGNFPNPGRNPLAGLGNTLARARLLVNPLFIIIGVVTIIFIFTLITIIAGPATIGEASPEPSVGFTPVTAPPPNTNTEALRKDLSNQFNVDFDSSFDSRYYNYLKWAWEVLWSVDNTRFKQLFNPNNNKIKVMAIPISAGFNEQYDCTKIGVRLGRINPPHDSYDEQYFKIIFTHEIGHLIENCNPDFVSLKIGLLDQLVKQEGFLTNFSENSYKVGDTPLNEDYAESFAYFINSTIPELKLNICSGCDPTPNADGQIVNPYQNNKPLHQKFIQDLLGVTAPAQQTTTLAQFSCPVAGTTWELHTPSFQRDPINGHCGSGYASSLSAAGDPIGVCPNGGNTRRGKSLDVITGGPLGKLVYLPTIDGKKVDWEFINKYELSAYDCLPNEIIDPILQPGQGCGIGYVFKTGQGNNNWVLHLVHMGRALLIDGQTYESGTPIGHTAAIHTHISIGKDIADPKGMLQTDPGWLAADTQLRICSSQ